MKTERAAYEAAAFCSSGNRMAFLYADVSCGTSMGMPKATRHITPDTASHTPNASAAEKTKQARLSLS